MQPEEHTPIRKDPRTIPLRSVARRRSPISTWRYLLVLLAHAGLAFAMWNSELVATAHALVTFGVGILWAASGRRPERVAWVAAYIVGAEVLWRMTETRIFWEFGKYATAAIFVISLLRSRRRKPLVSLFLYFALLIPSSFIVISELAAGRARRELSFNLAGPLALAVAAWFFSNVRLTREERVRLFLAMLAPIASIAALVLSGTMNTSDVVFASGISNEAMSGGFAPNQVSAVLGLGALLCFFVLSEERLPKGLRLLLFAGLVGLASQSALTFSRGGLYMAAGSATVASLFLMRDARSRVKVLLVAGLCFVVAKYVVLPRLDAFTGGSLIERFQDTGLTKRGDIARADIETWKSHLLFGVGPGLSKNYRDMLVSASGRQYTLHTHTEYTRLLAEHGLFGLVALILMLSAAYRAVRQARSRKGKAFSASLLVWSLLFMLVYAMRLATPSFIFGLAFASLEEEGGVARVPRGTHRFPGPAPSALATSPARST